MFKSFSRKRIPSPEVVSAAQIEAAATNAVSQVTVAIDSIEALADVRRDYVMSVFTNCTDDTYTHSANNLSATGEAYAHQVSALAELACTAALKLVSLPDQPGEPADRLMAAALVHNIAAHEAGMRIGTYGNVFMDLTGSTRLQDRYVYEYDRTSFEEAIEAHEQDQATLAARTTMPNGSITESTLHIVQRSLETSMNLEEIIAVQEYSTFIDAGLRDITE